MDINRIVLDSVALNMSAIDYQDNYCASNIDDPEAEGSYVVQFISIPYAIQHSMEVNVDTMV